MTRLLLRAVQDACCRSQQALGSTCLLLRWVPSGPCCRRQRCETGGFSDAPTTAPKQTQSTAAAALARPCASGPQPPRQPPLALPARHRRAPFGGP
jgi:hypothetical protein